MKISASQYAKALYDSVAGKPEKELKAALKNFVACLGRNRELAKGEEIIRLFSALWEKENGEVTATLLSARELGPTARETVSAYLKDRTGAKKVALKEEVDKGLIGGFILKYDSKVLDGSLKSSLENLKNKISN